MAGRSISTRFRSMFGVSLYENRNVDTTENLHHLGIASRTTFCGFPYTRQFGMDLYRIRRWNSLTKGEAKDTQIPLKWTGFESREVLRGELVDCCQLFCSIYEGRYPALPYQ